MKAKVIRFVISINSKRNVSNAIRLAAFVLLLACSLMVVGCGEANTLNSTPTTKPIPQTKPTTSPTNSVSSYSRDVSEDDNLLTRDDAILNHWDDIKSYLNGSETIEACDDNGNCYDLDADISSGSVDTVYFANGGYLSVSAEIDKNGEASDSDQQGKYWSFTLDMNSFIVDDAIREWSENNDFRIE